VGFYLGFYDLLEQYFLHLAEESRLSGKVLGVLNATFIAIILKKNRITKPLKITSQSRNAISFKN